MVANARAPSSVDPVPTAPRLVAAEIKQRILDGHLRPGDRLPPEPDLAQAFGMSRATIRSALQELCVSEVLTVHRGRTGGYRVSDISVELLTPRISDFITLSLTVKTLELPQVYEVRRTLELLIAELAAVRRSEEALQELEQLMADADEQPPATAMAAVDVDLRYHRALARCTDNPLLVALETAMDSAYRQFLGSSRKALSPSDILRSLHDVTSAVRKGDPAAARDAMDLHLSYSDQFFAVDGGKARHARETSS